MLLMASCGGCFGAQGDQGAADSETQNAPRYDEEDGVTGNGSNEESSGSNSHQDNIPADDDGGTHSTETNDNHQNEK